MTTTATAHTQTSVTTSPSPSRRQNARRTAAASAAAVVLFIGSGAGPLLATASAQSSALEQSLGGGQSLQQAQQRAKKPSTPAPTSTASESDLRAPADFSGPGLDKGVSLIGWAKAGALIVGVLTLTIGIPLSKALKEAGNHHASGIRAGAMGIGGAILLAGVAGTVLPKLMA